MCAGSGLGRRAARLLFRAWPLGARAGRGRGRLLDGARELDPELAAEVQAKLLGDDDPEVVPRVASLESESELAAGLAALCPAASSEQRIAAALIQSRHHSLAGRPELTLAYLVLALDEPIALDGRHYALVDRSFGVAVGRGYASQSRCAERWREQLRELYLDHCLVGDSRLSVNRGPTAEAICQTVLDTRGRSPTAPTRAAHAGVALR